MSHNAMNNTAIADELTRINASINGQDYCLHTLASAGFESVAIYRMRQFFDAMTKELITLREKIVTAQPAPAPVPRPQRAYTLRPDEMAALMGEITMARAAGLDPSSVLDLWKYKKSEPASAPTSFTDAIRFARENGVQDKQEPKPAPGNPAPELLCSEVEDIHKLTFPDKRSVGVGKFSDGTLLMIFKKYNGAECVVSRIRIGRECASALSMLFAAHGVTAHTYSHSDCKADYARSAYHDKPEQRA